MKYIVLKEFLTEKNPRWRVPGEVFDATTKSKKIMALLEKGYIEEVPERPRTVWDLKELDECWAIFYNQDSEGGAIPKKVHWHENEWQSARAMGEIHPTEAECNRVIACRQAETILRRDTKGFKPKFQESFSIKDYGWKVEYSPRYKKFIVVMNGQQDGTIRFATENAAKDSIKNHEKEWKAYLGVEE